MNRQDFEMRDNDMDGRDARGPDGAKHSRRRGCAFCNDESVVIDYKNPQLLRYFVSDRGKITPRRITGNCAKHQRKLTLAVKRARNIALMPFTANE